MTPQQTFSNLLQALTHCPEDHLVDDLLTDLVEAVHTKLRVLRLSSLKLACLAVTNPEVLMAADHLLQLHGLTLRFHRHTRLTHLVSIRHHTPTSEGARAA